MNCRRYNVTSPQVSPHQPQALSDQGGRHLCSPLDAAGQLQQVFTIHEIPGNGDDFCQWQWFKLFGYLRAFKSDFPVEGRVHTFGVPTIYKVQS